MQRISMFLNYGIEKFLSGQPDHGYRISTMFRAERGDRIKGSLLNVSLNVMRMNGSCYAK